MDNICPEFKVILVGEWGVGKSSLLRRFSQGTFTDTSGMDWHEYRESTIGLDNFCKRFECKTDSKETKTIGLRLFDTGGLERIGSIGTSYYKSADAALLVFARNNLDSFNCLTQHLLEVLSWAENAKLFLISNKEDINQKEVSDNDIQTFMQQFDKIETLFKVSCKLNEPPINDIFCYIAKVMTNSISLHRLNNRFNDVIKLTNDSQNSRSSYYNQKSQEDCGDYANKQLDTSSCPSCLGS